MTDAREHETRGLLLHSAAAYDLLAWAFLGGREREFRQRLLDLARVRPGEAVLDVGCGTGTLAILAKKQVGPEGTVHAVDGSPEMIARARWKAKRAGLAVGFENAVVEALPFSDGSFDVVLSTLMLHHLPRATREQCARELRRVVKKTGRVLTVDFGAPGPVPKGFLPRLHRHGGVALAEMTRVLGDAGLRVEESGAVGVKDLNFALASVP